jgi:hypothetical protein
VRRELSLAGPLAPARAADVGSFVAAAAAGLAIGLVMMALLVPVCIVSNVAALLRRR